MTTLTIGQQSATYTDGRWVGSPLIVRYMEEMAPLAELTLIAEGRYVPDQGEWEGIHALRFLGPEAELTYTPDEEEGKDNLVF